jgi:hypothetical protein
MIPNIIYSIIAGLFCILFVFLFIKKRRRNKIKKENVDISNIVIGVTKKDEMEKLYKDLTKLIHPDKNPERLDISSRYMAMLNESRRDYHKLTSLKSEIESIFRKA